MPLALPVLGWESHDLLSEMKRASTSLHRIKWMVNCLRRWRLKTNFQPQGLGRKSTGSAHWYLHIVAITFA